MKAKHECPICGRKQETALRFCRLAPTLFGCGAYACDECCEAWCTAAASLPVARVVNRKQVA